MERLKKIGKALLFPHTAVTVLCVIAAAAGLIWVFSTGHEESWPAYPIYVLSFYALVTACTTLIPAAIRLSKDKKSSAVAPEKKLRQKLYTSLTINWAYGAFQIITGATHADTWLWTNGVYNMVLALIRFVLVLYERRLVHSEDEENKLRLGWNSYLLCGGGLLILNLTMTGIVFQRIWNGEATHYPELVVYAVAAYTFYQLIMAIVNVFKSRKNTSPILAATRNLDLSVALMSLFSLQTAMFSSFGAGFEHQHLMNSLTGGGICLIVVCGAIGMLLHGRKIKKKIAGGNHHG